MADTRKRISILGSTGSIGCTALELVSRFENRFRVAFGEGDETGIESVGDVVDLLERLLSQS